MNDAVTSVLKHRATESTALVMVLVAALTFMDERHAMASDFEVVVSTIQSMRTDAVEADITEAEDTIDDVMFIPEAERSPRDHRDLRRAQTRKARYVRKLEVILKEVSK